MKEFVFLSIFFWTLPFWLPVVWAAFALGRRQFSIAALLSFITCEAIAIWLALWLPRFLTEFWPSD